MIKIDKKTLIVSSWAPPKLGGAQNLYNIFSNIDSADYSILTSRQNFTGKNGKLGLKLGCEYFFYGQETGGIAKESFYFIKRFPVFFKIVKNALFLVKFLFVGLMSTIKILKVGEYVGKNKEVDLLMGLSDDELNLFSTFILSKKLKKPFVVYLFDLYLGNQLNFPYNIIARAVEPIIFKKARHIIVTNDATKEYYIKKYGNAEKYSVIYNSAFPKKYAENILLTRNSKKTNIVFTGNINWPQESSLNDLLELISKSNESTINIAVYCPSPPVNLVKQYKDDKNIIFTFASQAEMPRIQSEADILFLPISWHTSSPDIVKTASPGKLTDYLIAGKPILIYAPEYSFVTRYAKENNFAEIVNKKDQNMLKGAIEKLINNKEYANLLVTNAKKTFYKHHDAVDNAIKLQKIINNL